MPIGGYSKGKFRLMVIYVTKLYQCFSVATSACLTSQKDALVKMAFLDGNIKFQGNVLRYLRNSEQVLLYGFLVDIIYIYCVSMVQGRGDVQWINYS